MHLTDKTIVFSLVMFGDGMVVDEAMWKLIKPYSFTLDIHPQQASYMVHFVSCEK